MVSSIRRTVLISCALASAGAASAHHGFGNFDLTQDVEIRGVVTKIDFVNPHSWLYLTATNAGSEVQWRCEMRAATVLRRSGWSPEMFQKGQQVTIVGSPDRTDKRSCYLSTITWADGTAMNRYGQREKTEPVALAERELRLPSGEINLAGDWASEQMVMTDPSGREGTLVPLGTASKYAPGEVPAGAAPIPGARNAPQTRTAARPQANSVELTAAGRAAAEGFDPRSPEDSPRLRCETTSILFDWTFDGPVNRITQDANSVTLQYGQFGFTRTVHMNAERPDIVAPSRAGHSIGRWEDDVLVVDTVGFLPGVLSGATLHSDQLHVVERFSYDPARKALSRSYTAKDPLYFVDQLAGADTLYPADVPYSPDPCNELTFVNYEQDANPPEVAPPEKPWWKFWD